MTPIDLDANATTPLHPAAFDAMARAYADGPGNPASSHHAGRQARRLLETARETVARVLIARPEWVVFTSGATEANNLAVFGQAVPDAHFIASRIEHPCVVGPLEQLAKTGHAVDWLPVNPRGFVDPGEVAARVRPATRLVCVMLANHETGAIQPVRAVVDHLPAGVALHCDAAQAAGKIPVDFTGLGVATLSVSGHKFGGPKGVGAVLVRPGVTLKPLFYGGHQQEARRPGTEPVALAVGLAAALDAAAQRLRETHLRLADLRAEFLARVEAAVPDVVVNGPRPGDPDGLPTTLNLAFPGGRSDVLLMSLDLAGVACSAGAACASGSLLPSPVLAAMQVPDAVLRAAVRFSFGANLTREQVIDAAGRVAACVRAVREG